MRAWRVLRLGRVDSTQDVARELGEAGTVVVARVQTKGRGRRGNAWHSPEGGLWLSAVIPPPIPTHISVARAIASGISTHYGIRVSPEPPNDLSFGGRKLGGILIEAVYRGREAAYGVVGVGINANNPVPAELRGRAVALREALGREVDLDELLGVVLSSLEVFLRWEDARDRDYRCSVGG